MRRRSCAFRTHKMFEKSIVATDAALEQVARTVARIASLAED